MKLDEAQIAALMPEIDWIEDSTLRNGVYRYWMLAWSRSGWNGGRLEDVPYNTQIGSATLVRHSRMVANIVNEVARLSQAFHGIALNRDHLIAAAILHDACKLLEMQPDGEGAVKTLEGESLAHGILGGYLAREVGLPLDVEHMIVTHTPQSKMLPKGPEGGLLRRADLIDADLLYASAGLETFLSRGE